MNGDKIMFEINGYTKQLGIIGYPVEHTFSPNMHNFISETVHNNYVYGAWCVKPEDLKDAINGMRALGISGINVTAPHKVEVMKYIDVVTDGAKKLGSVNTEVLYKRLCRNLADFLFLLFVLLMDRCGQKI